MMTITLIRKNANISKTRLKKLAQTNIRFGISRPGLPSKTLLRRNSSNNSNKNTLLLIVLLIGKLTF